MSEMRRYHADLTRAGDLGMERLDAHDGASVQDKVMEVLAAGGRAGDLRIDAAPLDVLSRCVMDVLWVPGNIIADIDTSAALTPARDTVLRGITRRL